MSAKNAGFAGRARSAQMAAVADGTGPEVLRTPSGRDSTFEVCSTRTKEAQKMTTNNPLPETGFLRLKQIIGDPKATPPVPAIIPVSRSSWIAGVKSGIYPQPVRLGLGSRSVGWTVESIRDLLTSLKSAV
jgi:prophage regulatory protein